jgi:hypothetical protein
MMEARVNGRPRINAPPFVTRRGDDGGKLVVARREVSQYIKFVDASRAVGNCAARCAI